MIDRYCYTPQTLDEAANVLINDLNLRSQQRFINLTEEDVEKFLAYISLYVIKEFKLYSITNPLYKSCMDYAKPGEKDQPVRVIFRRMYEILNNIHIDEKSGVTFIEG